MGGRVPWGPGKDIAKTSGKRDSCILFYKLTAVAGGGWLGFLLVLLYGCVEHHEGFEDKALNRHM